MHVSDDLLAHPNERLRLLGGGPATDDGALDLRVIDSLMIKARDSELTSIRLCPPSQAPAGELRLKVYRIGAPLSLSQLLPVLSTMGVEVVDERPFQLAGTFREAYMYDLGLRYDGQITTSDCTRFEEAVQEVWNGSNEADGFNRLVLAGGLTWRQAALLRVYAKYIHQGGTPFTPETVEGALADNVDIARLLVAFFEARFDPGDCIAHDAPARVALVEERDQAITSSLDEVASLDHDRVLRSFQSCIRATSRTNYFQRDRDGAPKPYLCFKLEPHAIPELPDPRPRFEIFVHSPRVEGVHLRFGRVARGGLRWSDRRDDFRTEVLGLVKAQMVKNTVIVPVGAKGGFYCKQLPDPFERDARLAEGIDCYKTFISGLLDLTDNLVKGTVRPPQSVVRYDGDDAYLVVAADKGTATFSDIANSVSLEYGHWLGDAFASGGSVGYDHKGMGITARGAWESVKRHFRARGLDCQEEDFTCVGIGDMSGDVFGNGMLLSRHTRLVAAFDHRDIFLDPDPDPATSYAERERLAGLPQSSWQDYNPTLISVGGGVFSRSAKSIPLSEAVRAALRIPCRDGQPVTSMTPTELITAILLADVDLLWNGGIGTYVKATDETHTEVGDKANDQIRVNGAELRARVVGEGGNLGFTQAGRVEYARLGCAGLGGRINTDFIDNSAGVDTSDHEVNIKILLDAVVADGELGRDERTELLASMSDEVADLVLGHTYAQNTALAMSAAEAPRQAPVHEDWMRKLESQGLLNRELERLPTSEEMRRRIDAGDGLTGPELAVLLAYTKIALADSLLATDLAEDTAFHSHLERYFPQAMREKYLDRLVEHPLRREIIVTEVVNDLVNGAGTTYIHRLSEETREEPVELVRANFLARTIFGTPALIGRINELDNAVPASLLTEMRAEIRDLVERAARWLVYNRSTPLDVAGTAALFQESTRTVVTALPDLFTGQEREAFLMRNRRLVDHGVPDDLATAVAAMAPAYTVLTIVGIAAREGVDPADTAEVHFRLAELLGLTSLAARIRALPRADRWQTMARVALREDMHAVHGELTAMVLRETDPRHSAGARIEAWERKHHPSITPVVSTLAKICADDGPDLAAPSVGVRITRSLLHNLRTDDE